MNRVKTYHNPLAFLEGGVTPRQRKLDWVVGTTARARPPATAAETRLPKLGSRWARQLAASSACSACRGSTRRMWRCRTLHDGDIVLCEECKARAFEQSFGRLDAATRSTPAPFESNRQRH